MNYKTKIKIDGKEIETLSDIIPNNKTLKILFIAKTPALKSVEIGHYFQGRQGKSFWNRLIEYNILNAKPGTFEDENLIEHNYGITDIVKIPRNYGDEPSDYEYINGLKRIQKIIKKNKPEIIIFVYKRVLDKILKYVYPIKIKSKYGFNENLENFFGAKIFVFPMNGTPCPKSDIIKYMNELKNTI